MFKHLPLFLFFILPHPPSTSEIKKIKPIFLNDGSKSYDIGDQVFLLEDVTDTLSFKDILRRSDEFRPALTKVPVYGTTSSSIWVKFTVKNFVKEKWYLEIGTSHLSLVDLFYFQEGNWKQVKSGVNREFNDKPIRINDLILPLPLSTLNKTTFFLRVKSRTIIKLPLRIATLTTLYEKNHRVDIANGIYFGLIITLSIYNFFVFILLRDKTYIYYVMYILMVGLDIAYIRGYTHKVISTFLPWMTQMNIFISLTIIFLLLFTESFLNLPTNVPQTKKVINPIMVITLTCSVGTYLGFDLLALKVLLTIVFVVTFFVLGVAFYTLKKGFEPVKIFTLGFLIFTGDSIVFILKDQGFLPVNFFTESSMQIGSALEAIIFSFALATKLNNLKRENEMAKEKALLQSKDFSFRLIQLQEEERKRVAVELHDSVGQSLSLIKNKIMRLKQNIAFSAYEAITDAVAETIQEVRSISYRLRPFHLDLLGLTQALKSLAEESSEANTSPINFNAANVDGIFSKDDEIAIYRILEYIINSISTRNKVESTNVELLLKNRALIIVVTTLLKEAKKLVICKNNDFATIQERISMLEGEFKHEQLKPAFFEATILIPIKS